MQSLAYVLLPYEVRMKHLIEAYRRDLKRLGELSRYAEGLEEENLLLQKKIAENEKWTKDYPDKEKQIKQLSNEVRQLKGMITETFPKRIITVSQIRRKVIDLSNYIIYLQSLLTKNEIAHDERKPNPSKKVEDIRPEAIDALPPLAFDHAAIMKNAIELYTKDQVMDRSDIRH